MMELVINSDCLEHPLVVFENRGHSQYNLPLSLACSDRPREFSRREQWLN